MERFLKAGHFNPAPPGEARLLIRRGSGWIGATAPMPVTIGECEFEIGIEQFAVCSVKPGRSDIVHKSGIDTIQVRDGEWACVSLQSDKFKWTWAPHDCRSLMTELGENRQVWTTQIPESEIALEAHHPGAARDAHGRRIQE